MSRGPGFGTDAWAAELADRCAGDAELAARLEGRQLRFVLVAPESGWLVSLGGGDTEVMGRITATMRGEREQEFALQATEAVWDDCLSGEPTPGHHDIMAMWHRGALEISGDVRSFVRNLGVVRRFVEIGRAVASGEDARRETGGEELQRDLRGAFQSRLESAVGRYMRLPILGVEYRVYFEEAGDGPPVVLLHTAAGDSRQYRRLLEDTEYHRFRLIAPDLPWHGRSLPPDGWWEQRFELTREFYAEAVESFIDALGLERVALVGTSMAAQIVLDLLRRRPGAYRSIIAIGALDHGEGKPASWLHDPEVNESEAVPAWVAGMTGPGTPKHRRGEIEWIYSQSGAGVFVGDAHFFQEDWDIRDGLADLDLGSCELHFFAGEFDYTRPPQTVAELAARVAGASFTELRGCGHFPMVEDAGQLKRHLLPALVGISAD